MRQIERNSIQPSDPSICNAPHSESSVSSDQVPVGFLQPSETSIPSPTPLVNGVNGVNGVIESSEIGSPTILSDRISEQLRVDAVSTPSLSRDSGQAGPSAALTKLPNNSEEALRKLFRLRDRNEMAAWLTQVWVADIYIEYYNVAIDHWRRAMEAVEAAGGEIPPQERRSSQKFLVHRAADALRSRSPRYVSTPVAKAYWTKDDHDIRFIVRIVDEGRASGRCWERYTSGDHTEYLCAVAYRLMCWLRAMHKITVATSGMSRWHKANCDRWFNILRRIRDQRADSREEVATARASLPHILAVEAPTGAMPQSHAPTQEQAQSPQSYMSQNSPLDGRLLPALSPATSLDYPDIRDNLTMTPTFFGNSTHDPAYGNSSNVAGSKFSRGSRNEVWSREHPQVPIQDDDSSGDARSVRHPDSQDGQDCVNTDFTTLNTASVKIEPGLFEIEQANPSRLSLNLDLEIPHVPSYRAPRSKKGKNQMKAIEWMLQPGKDRFEAHQDKVLGRWGVTAEHAGTCILIPASWSGLDPQDLVHDFSYQKCPTQGIGKRLVGSGMGYTY